MRARLRLHRWLIDRVTALLAALCCVHCKVGVAEQALGGLARGAQYDAHTRADRDRVFADAERLCECPSHRFGSGHGVGMRCDASEDRGELVAPEARHRVLGLHGRLQAACAGGQHGVADVVTEAVVDRLEIVDVDEQHREPAAPSRCGRLRVAQAVTEVAPVGDPGECIV